ncbi:MAG: ABC transporter ATP-binding protein [Caldilineaceae bacterium]|nr:ABC transporter ATP-binding protein [Caldilineaceae bacterium]
MENSPVIQMDGVSRRFGDVIAVDELSIQVRAGEIFGVLGHNGAGKTTTVRLLNGVLTPTGGVMRVLGLNPIEDGPQLRRRTGVLTETPSLDERLSARENLIFFATLYGVDTPDIARRVGEMLETFELSDRANEKVGGYSKGMKQRLALARSLIHRPDLLFLDEPAAALDPVATRQLHGLIRRLSHYEKRTIFLCTHNLDEAQRLCDRVAVLEHGRLVAIGTPAELGRQLGSAVQLDLEVSPIHMAVALSILKEFPNLVATPDQEGEIEVSGAQREQIPALVAALAKASVPIYRVALQEPSLEDVYFALHGASTGRGALHNNGRDRILQREGRS